MLAGNGDARLLDSYEGERCLLARDVVTRTMEESVNPGRSGKPPHGLADTQILLNYRGCANFLDHGAPAPTDSPVPGDRAPDAQGLRRCSLGFPLRLFGLTCGTELVLLVVAESDAGSVATLEAHSQALAELGLPLRMVAITLSGAPEHLPQPVGITVVSDADGSFAATYRAIPGWAFLVRPDGYLAWTARPFAPEALVQSI